MIPKFDRFWAYVEEDPLTGCWEWRGGRQRYGTFALTHEQRVYAHRYAYRQLVGPIPSWLTVDHLCRNRFCVNPGHMELVSLRENILRGGGWAAVNARKTHCHRGHPFDEENTCYSSGRRNCKACMRIRGRQYYSNRTYAMQQQVQVSTLGVIWNTVKDIGNRIRRTIGRRN